MTRWGISRSSRLWSLPQNSSPKQEKSAPSPQSHFKTRTSPNPLASWTKSSTLRTRILSTRRWSSRMNWYQSNWNRESLISHQTTTRETTFHLRIKSSHPGRRCPVKENPPRQKKRSISPPGLMDLSRSHHLPNRWSRHRLLPSTSTNPRTIRTSWISWSTKTRISRQSMT